MWNGAEETKPISINVYSVFAVTPCVYTYFAVEICSLRACLAARAAESILEVGRLLQGTRTQSPAYQQQFSFQKNQSEQCWLYTETPKSI